MSADVAAINALVLLVVPGDVVIPRLTVHVLGGCVSGGVYRQRRGRLRALSGLLPR